MAQNEAAIDRLFVAGIRKQWYYNMYVNGGEILLLLGK